MEFIKKSYYYFFYKVFKSIEYTSDLSGGKFFSAFKASIVLIALEFWLTIAILNYYNIFIDRHVHFPKSYYVGIALFFSFLSYITIDYNDVWKYYNRKFDKLPKQKNKIGSWIVFLIIIFIITFFIYSIYLMSQIDWSQYK